MRVKVRLLTVTSVAGLLIFSLAGCSFNFSIGTKKVDTEKGEKEIQRALINQAHDSGITVKCPRDIKVEEGSKFNCVATDSKGQKLSIEVTQMDDQGGVSWRVLSGSGNSR